MFSKIENSLFVKKSEKSLFFPFRKYKFIIVHMWYFKSFYYQDFHQVNSRISNNLNCIFPPINFVYLLDDYWLPTFCLYSKVLTKGVKTHTHDISKWNTLYLLSRYHSCVALLQFPGWNFLWIRVNYP